MTLYCALCLHVRPGNSYDAVTIISGTAACREHMCYFESGATLSQAVATWNDASTRKGTTEPLVPPAKPWWAR